MRDFRQWKRETAGRELARQAGVPAELRHVTPLTVDGVPFLHPPRLALDREAHAEMEPEAGQ